MVSSAVAGVASLANFAEMAFLADLAGNVTVDVTFWSILLVLSLVGLGFSGRGMVFWVVRFTTVMTIVTIAQAIGTMTNRGILVFALM